MQTPLKKAIQAGTTLNKTKKKMQTPLRKEIHSGITLRKTRKCLPTPLKEDILQGKQLKSTKRKMQTPITGEIQDGATLKSANCVKVSEQLVEDCTEVNDETVESKSTARKFLKAKRHYPQREMPVQDLRHVILTDNDLKKVNLYVATMPI